MLLFQYISLLHSISRSHFLSLPTLLSLFHFLSYSFIYSLLFLSHSISLPFTLSLSLSLSFSLYPLSLSLSLCLSLSLSVSRFTANYKRSLNCSRVLKKIHIFIRGQKKLERTFRSILMNDYL